MTTLTGPRGWRRLTPSDYRVVPWKNGGGTTTEVAKYPPTSEVMDQAEPFVWRVSIAALDGSGPFSTFPSVDRIIMQLDGKPMTLDHGAEGRHQLTPLVPYRFRGEWTTHGHLDGTARDFNVMTRRGRASAHVEVLSLAPGATLTRGRPMPGRDAAATWVVHVLSGELSSPGAHANDTLVGVGGALELVASPSCSATTLVVVMVRCQA